MEVRHVVRTITAMSDGVMTGEHAGKLRSSHKPDLCLRRSLTFPCDHDSVAEGVLAGLTGEGS